MNTMSSHKSKPLMVRLPKEYLPAFEHLADSFAGLPPATILKMITQFFLEMDHEEQVRAIDEQIRHPKRSRNRVPPHACMNAASRSTTRRKENF
ncbi:MAG: hypothetical protein M5U26_30385 [Planctomycetota bacterium]|nr:hypothetical protein [Planctomycetota bacterium]